jgi:hypothetical protein
VLAAAQVLGHIDESRANPARWRGWLDKLLPNPKKIGRRDHLPAMPYGDVPVFMGRLRASRSRRASVPFKILTVERSSEVLDMV